MIKPVITLNQIKPATPKVSDKYSYNLWEWVSQFQKDYHQLPSVYAVVPVSETFDMSELKKGHWPIYLGLKQQDGSLSAAELNSVLGCQPQIWSFTPEVHFESSELIEITEAFWSTYQAIGRCLFHDHAANFIVGASERFTYNEEGDMRTCQWCGHQQARQLVEVVKIEERWV